MAIPGHEFLTAHFSNNDRTIVEAYWTTPDGKETRVEYIEDSRKEYSQGNWSIIETISLESFLQTGITDDTLRKVGHSPAVKDMLNMLDKGIAIDFFTDFIND